MQVNSIYWKDNRYRLINSSKYKNTIDNLSTISSLRKSSRVNKSIN